jgi:hypothetical protein
MHLCFICFRDEALWNVPMCEAKLKFCSAIISHHTAYRRDALAEETEATAGLTRLGLPTNHKQNPPTSHQMQQNVPCFYASIPVTYVKLFTLSIASSKIENTGKWGLLCEGSVGQMMRIFCRPLHSVPLRWNLAVSVHLPCINRF